MSLEGIPKPAGSAEGADVARSGVLNAAGRPEAAPPDGPPKPVKVDDVMVEVGGANTVREFSENLRGARPGEQKSFEVLTKDN